MVDDSKPSESLEAYGDTRKQTEGVLRRIEEHLQSIGLGMGDVVKMQVFLVGDPAKGGRMDLAGLANPGWLVEIEVVAVRR